MQEGVMGEGKHMAIDEMWGIAHDAESQITEIRRIAKQVFADETATGEDMLQVTRALRNMALTAMQAFQEAENAAHAACVLPEKPDGTIDGLDHWEIPVMLTYPIVASDVALRHAGDAEIDFKDRGFERIRAALDILSGGASVSWFARRKDCRRVAQ